MAPLLVSLLLTATAAPAPAAAPAALALRGGEWHGSAVVWSREGGLLLTALHVVEEMPSVEARLPGGAWVPARIVDRDPMLDLALLDVGAAELPAALPIAAPTWAGAPARLAACPALACGSVAAEVTTPLRSFAGSRYVELRGDARPGASGGAVLDARGALLGIVDLALRPRGVALAIPVDRAVARFPRPPSTPPPSAAIVELVRPR